MAPAITLPAGQGYSLHLYDNQQPWTTPRQSVPTLLQLFIRGNPFRSSAGLIELAQRLIQHLESDLQAIIVYGSPYVLPQLKPSIPPDLPTLFSYGQMPTAQTLALQTLWGRAERREILEQAFTD
jgi:beta-glucosidase